MNAKDNRRVKLTRQLLHNALLALLADHPLSKISVSDLCKTADINRSTFYAHYNEPSDVMNEIEEEIISRFPVFHNLQAKAFTEQLQTLFTYFTDNRQSLPLLLERDATFRKRLIDSAVHLYIEAQTKDNPNTSIPPQAVAQILHIEFIAAGSLHLIEQWLRGEIRLSTEEIIRYLYDFAGEEPLRLSHL